MREVDMMTPTEYGSSVSESIDSAHLYDQEGHFSESEAQDTPWIMKRVPFALTLLVTALIAMWATLTIIIERSQLMNGEIAKTSCDINPWLSCGTVMKSWQAMTFGFPNTYIGVVGFSVLITVAMSLLAGAQFKKWYWIAMNVGQLAAFGFSVWLWYSAVYEIGTLCLYCMIVWLMVIIQLALITTRNLHHFSTSKKVRDNAPIFMWPFVVLVAAGVIVSILTQFGLGVLGLES